MFQGNFRISANLEHLGSGLADFKYITGTPHSCIHAQDWAYWFLYCYVPLTMVAAKSVFQQNVLFNCQNSDPHFLSWPYEPGCFLELSEVHWKQEVSMENNGKNMCAFVCMCKDNFITYLKYMEINLWYYQINTKIHNLNTSVSISYET